MTNKHIKDKKEAVVNIKKRYFILGKSFLRREDAINEIIEIHRKGFANTGLLTLENSFVIKFGEYNAEEAARASLEKIKAAGIEVGLENI